MKKALLFFSILCCCNLSNLMAQTACTQYDAGPYSDQVIDVAGCNGETLSATYQAWLNEIYFTEVVAGGNYTFDICNGYDENAWGAPAVITVILGGTPTAGTVEGGTVLATVEGCTVTFDATESGTAFFILSTANDCGGAVAETENGYPTITTNSGVDCVVVPCADAAAGTASGTADICFGESTDLIVTGAIMPTDDVNGFVWVVSTEDISGSTSPNTEASFIGNFAVMATVPTVAAALPNNGAATTLPAGTYYFTPVVFANAVGGPTLVDPNTGEPTLTFDPNCTFTGNSVFVTFYANGDPNCLPTCPQIGLKPTDCVDGEFSIEISTTSMGELASFDISDDQGNTATITGVGLSTFGPYASGTVVTISTSTGGNCDAQFLPIIRNCPPCDIVVGGDFESGINTDWTEYEDPDQLNLNIVTSATAANVTANSGNFLAWLGGYNSEVSNTLEQSITFPDNGGAELSFFAWIAACGVPEDYFKVYIDNTEIFSLMGDSPDCGGTTYQEYTVDVSSYCDGANHNLRFVVQENEGGANATNIFLDDVFIIACGSQCLAEAGTVANPAVTGNDIVVAASGYNSNAEYTYIYYLSQNNAPTYTIAYQNTNGVFSNVADGSYVLHTLSVPNADYATVQGALTIDDISDLITGNLICGELNLAVASNLVVNTGIGVANANPSFQIANIMPMPVTNTATLTFSYTGNSQVNTTIYDLTGRVVDTYQTNAQTGFNQLVLNTNNYTSGVYFVAINDGKSLATAKFVK